MAGFTVTHRGLTDGASRLPKSGVTAQSSLGINPVPGVLPVANILDPQWGGKADAILVTDAAITTGTNALSSTQAAFTTANVGQFVIVQGAGPNITAVPGPFSAYIGSVSSGVASLVTTKGGGTPANASNSVSGVQAAFGTALSGPITTALASGQRVYLPAGNYIWDTAVSQSAALHLTGEKDRTIIYHSGLTNLLHVTGPGLQGSSATLSANANWNDQSLSASSIPTGLKAGDFIFLSSTDVFDATEPATTCGEIIRVQGISGTTIALFNPVAGPNNYLTASGATIQKITFLEGVTIDDIEFVNAAPEILQEGFAAPATQTVTAGNGGTGVIWLQYCRGAELNRVRAVGWAGSFLVNGPASIETHTTDCHFRGGAQAPVAGTYGYAISHYGSQWSPVDDCTIDRSHGFVNQAGSGNLALNLPSRFNITTDCIAYNGTNDTFLVHNAAAYCDFVDCTSIGGPLFPAENTHEMGFQIVGHYCKLIRPSVLNGTGRAINCGGNHCEVIDPVIRNMRPWNDRCRGITLSDGTSAPPGFTGGAGGHKVINADIDGIPFASGNTDGIGIFVNPSTPNCEISGRIRNTAWNGVQIGDTSDTTVIDGLTGINNGNAGVGSVYVIQTATTNPAAQWQNVRAINPRTDVTNQPSGLIPVTYGETLRGLIGPEIVLGTTTTTPTASRAYFVRIAPKRRMAITKIAFVTNAAANSNDAIDVGIYDASLNKITTTGSTASVANATAGVQAVTIATTVLAANTVYYLAFAYGTIGGVAAVLVTDSTVNGNLASLFGTSAPNVLRGFANTAFPLPASITPGGIIAAVPILAARES